MKIGIFVFAVLLVALAIPSSAQPLPPVSGESLAMETGYFNLMIDPNDYPGSEKDETEDIHLLSLITAYGLVYGIDWSRIGTDNKVVIDEGIYKVVRDLHLDEITPYDHAIRYTYSYQYVVNDMEKQKNSESIMGFGESTEKNTAKAWREARTNAFLDVINKALARKYTDNQLAIPNEVIGQISTYEVIYDDYNFADKKYEFKIKAWVTFGKRGNLIDMGNSGSSEGTEDTGSS